MPMEILFAEPSNPMIYTGVVGGASAVVDIVEGVESVIVVDMVMSCCWLLARVIVQGQGDC